MNNKRNFDLYSYILLCCPQLKAHLKPPTTIENIGVRSAPRRLMPTIFLDGGCLLAGNTPRHHIPSAYVHFNLQGFTPEPETTSLVPHEIATKYTLFPIIRTDTHLILAMANPGSLLIIKKSEISSQYQLEGVYAPEEEIRQAIHDHYPAIAP